MSDSVIQTSFNSGEWAPALNARVDLQKYHSGAALLRNFFVDYRGGATTRPGTKYILQTKSTSTVRLIPFQASFTVSYILEFGDGYVRFFTNGSAVLETPLTITAATAANPGVLTHNAHGYSNGDWVLASSFAGGTWGTHLNGNYYIIANATANTFTLTDLNGVAVNTSTYGTYTGSTGTTSRVYTITSPYTATELSQIKFAQNVTQLILCHPNHGPYALTLISAASWTLAAITFGSTVTAPTGQAVATTLGAGTVNYAYVITALDANAQESAPSAFATLANKLDIRSVAGTNTVTWNSVSGASGYNIYRAQVSYAGAVPAGSMFGFIGTTTSTTLIDSNIDPDFTQTPPVPQNPFSGSGVQSVTLTNAANYTNLLVPTVTFTGGGGTGAQATANVICINCGVSIGGTGYLPGDRITLGSGIILRVDNTAGAGNVQSVALVYSPIFPTGTPIGFTTSPQADSGTSGLGTGFIGTPQFAIASVGVTNPGTGYGPAPAVNFSTGAQTATAVLGAPSSGNPTVPGFFQQRLVLAGPVSAPQQFNMSKPGAFFNFDISQIIQPNDAIQGQLVSTQLNTIQSMISQPAGLIFLSDKQAWLINGGNGPGSAISTTAIVANSQSYNGSSGPPPIVATNDVLYVQAKGSIVRDLRFDFYVQVYTGTDISAISSHLFFGYTLLEWAWAEEPFKVVWVVRNDGTLLSLTFLKEQDFVAWAHSDTNGSFKSIATVVEASIHGSDKLDAIYTVIQRTINGNTLQYIERFTEINPSGLLADALQVDANISYTGASTLTFSGAQHLAGMTVTGIATTDTGTTAAITPFVMPTSGTFTLPTPTSPATGYTYVLVGLGFTAQLKTLAIDTGNPNIQGKVKQLPDVTIRVASTLGLEIGQDFDHLTPMKDLVIGNVSSMLTGQQSQLVSDLVTGDARTFIGPAFTVPGQYCIQQSNPYPATILGVIPNIVIGDK